MMATWKEFLDSLSSRGGSVLMLLLCSFLFGAAALKFTGSTFDQTFAAFTGALLMALTNSGKAATGTDTMVVSASSAEPKKDVPKLEQR